MGKWWMEKSLSELHKGHIYWHFAGYYMRFTVVICTICSNGVKVLIFCHLEIEILFIPPLFSRELCVEFLFCIRKENMTHHCGGFYRN